MKKYVLMFLMLWMCLESWSQSPQKFSYQALIRNNNNQLVVNNAIGMQVSILQGSITGTSIFVERHFPTTNANGLVSIEIGTGTMIKGNLNSIDWANGPYFIKTETDLNGGANYTISGTSQLLSVPYALHAKTAESATESDPVFLKSPSYLIGNTNISNWNTAYGWGNHKTAGYVPNTRTLTLNGLSFDLSSNRNWNVGTVTTIETGNGITGGPITSGGTIGLTGQALALHNLNVSGFFVRTNSGNITSRTLTEGKGISITNGNGVLGNPTIAIKTYKVGDFAHGGIVFWVDETGQYGLVCAKKDIDGGSGVRWNAGTSTYTMARGEGPFSGSTNNLLIIANQGYGDGSTYAALICNELQITEGSKTFGNWYLPSENELGFMYENRIAINNTAAIHGGNAFIATLYWSSTEYNQSFARFVNFNNGNHGMAVKGQLYRVRAIRAF